MPLKDLTLPSRLAQLRRTTKEAAWASALLGRFVLSETRIKLQLAARPLPALAPDALQPFDRSSSPSFMDRKNMTRAERLANPLPLLTADEAEQARARRRSQAHALKRVIPAVQLYKSHPNPFEGMTNALGEKIGPRYTPAQQRRLMKAAHILGVPDRLPVCPATDALRQPANSNDIPRPFQQIISPYKAFIDSLPQLVWKAGDSAASDGSVQLKTSKAGPIVFKTNQTTQAWGKRQDEIASALDAMPETVDRWREVRLRASIVRWAG